MGNDTLNHEGHTMSRPRITETDILLINEWLTELETNPVLAISSHTGDETAILASQTKQLIKDQQEEIDNWVNAYAQY